MGRLLQTAFGGPEGVLSISADYTTGSSISNNRILNIQDGKVFFCGGIMPTTTVKRP